MSIQIGTFLALGTIKLIDCEVCGWFNHRKRITLIYPVISCPLQRYAFSATQLAELIPQSERSLGARFSAPWDFFLLPHMTFRMKAAVEMEEILLYKQKTNHEADNTCMR